MTAAVVAVLVAVVAPGAASAQVQTRAPSTQMRPTASELASAAQVAAGEHDPGDSGTDEDDTAVLTESRDQVMSRVAGLDTRIRAAETAAAEARASVDAANSRAVAAQADADRAARGAEQAAADVRAYAVEAYVRPPAQDALSALSIEESRDAGYATDVLRIVAERRRRVVDTMVATKVIADQDRTTADAAAASAQTALERADQESASLRSARSQQSRLAAQLDDRLDQKLAEAAALSEIDQRTSKELAAQEVALRSSGPAAAPAGTPVAATRPSPAGTTTPTPRPSVTVPGAPATTTPPVTTPPSSVPGLVTWADVVKAGGIWVHTSIAGRVSAMVSAARAAGFTLAGGGYRDPASQIALRRAHCGTSDYAIYQMPASQCTPPTAIPGRSMHERGLALDLTSSGRLITSRADPAFVWLAGNAARYGFYNLPSEPWHWSTTGS